MNFGKIDQWILFGGGRLLSRISLKLKEHKVKFSVVTSDRHSSDLISISEKVTLRDFLIANDIDFHISEDVNNDSDVISRITKNTMGVSMGAAWIFKAVFIKLFKGKLINLHGTKLPQDRGGGGFSWRILRDEHLGISLIHQIEPGVDTGDIVKYSEYFFPDSCSIPIDYMDFYVDKYIELFEEFLGDVLDGKDFEPTRQQEYFSAYWPRLNTDIHGFIDWNWKLKDIEQFICAFDDPYKGAVTFLNGKKVRLKKCLTTVYEGTFHPFQKGINYKKSNGILFIATEDGTLIVRDIRDENGFNIADTVSIGDRFYTPSEYLESAKNIRAVYTSYGSK